MKLTTGLPRTLAEIVLFAALACNVLHAQDEGILKAQSTLATARFHVEQNGRYVPGLKQQDVLLLEDGEP